MTAAGFTENIAESSDEVRYRIGPTYSCRFSEGSLDILDMYSRLLCCECRSRAHANPLAHNDAFDYPAHPDKMDWSALYPTLKNPKISILDIGCGFGGLTVALSGLFPEKTILAVEIRPQVCEFVSDRISELRKKTPPQCHNAAVLRTNAMKYLPNFLRHGQLEKMLFCFPDPHFKRKNRRRRIISERLLTEYAYLLAEGGLLYAITDVQELHLWHVAALNAHPCFESVAPADLDVDPTVNIVRTSTEEGRKVERAGGEMWLCVYRRRLYAEIAMTRWPIFTSEDVEEKAEESD